MAIVTCIGDIPALPWAGNFATDAPLFEAVDAFILSSSDRNVRREAHRLVNLHGCGEIVEVSDADLDFCDANMGAG